MIPYGRQSIDQSDIDAVVKTLKSDYLTQGPAVNEFEKDLSDYCGAKYCLAVANGTAALHLAVAALELEKGSQGITSPITFAASSNAMVYNELRPVFADINDKTYNIDIDFLKSKVSEKTSLIIPVHFTGQPCRMVEIKDLADQNNIRIIEDAAHAIGSQYEDGSYVGNCKYSDMTIFSFHPVKTITTGEGGAITTNSKELYEKLLLLRSHGITKDTDLLSKNPGPWYYEMQSLGFNYRLTDLQAALGSSQLKRLNKYKERRREIIKIYNNAFQSLDYIITPFEKDKVSSCFHLYVILIDYNLLNLTRKEVMNLLKEKGVLTQVHYIPVHLQPFYKDNYGYKTGDYPAAEHYYEKCLSIPLFPAMTNNNVETVIAAIKSLRK